MDIANEYSKEMLFQSLQSDEKIVGLLEFLVHRAMISEDLQAKTDKKIDRLQETADDINSKIDKVLEKLDTLETDFADLKNESRDVEQKLLLLTAKLNKLEIQSEDLEDYYTLSQNAYDNWDDFDVLTKQFIPLAEFLYSKLQKYDKPDYSPVILELCRAIENEFLLKVFKKYTLGLIDRKGRNLDRFLSGDRLSSDLKSKTGQFVKTVSRAARTHNPEFTLGQMNTILSMVNDTSIVSQSPLMRDFLTYLQSNTEASRLLDPDYIRKVNDIVNKYRNPSAHPQLMSLEKANECREIMPDRLDYLLECVLV